jgi:hypothetical protein
MHPPEAPERAQDDARRMSQGGMKTRPARLRKLRVLPQQEGVLDFQEAQSTDRANPQPPRGTSRWGHGDDHRSLAQETARGICSLPRLPIFLLPESTQSPETDTRNSPRPFMKPHFSDFLSLP